MTGRFASSLRVRLLGSLAMAVVCSAVAVATLQHVAESGRGPAARVSRLLIGDEWPEPWQDLAVLLPFSVIVLLLASSVSLWSLRPLLRASQEASAVGPKQPEARIAPDGLPAETAPLVLAVNGALDRLADAFENERRFVADAAHELRTPIAALRLRLQHARSEAACDWNAVDHDCAALARLVNQLLDLARKDRTSSGQQSGSFCNVARVGREAASVMLPLIEQAGRRFVVDLPDTLAVAGDPDDLRDMLRNLLENALVHGAGCITLSVGSRTRDGRERVVLRISDEGPGVEPAHRDAVFERFRKGGGGGAGCGLGLAIARAVAEAHGGSIRFVGDLNGGPDNGGAALCIVEAELPRRIPPAARIAMRM